MQYKNEKRITIKFKICLSVIATTVVILAFGYSNIYDDKIHLHEQAMAKQKGLKEIESMKKEKQRLENNSDFGDEYKELVKKIGDKEREYDIFDYKSDLEGRINTIEVALADMQREMKDGAMPDKIVPDAENRIKSLTLVVTKYKEALKNAKGKPNFIYKELNNRFAKEIDSIYKKIN